MTKSSQGFDWNARRYQALKNDPRMSIRIFLTQVQVYIWHLMPLLAEWNLVFFPDCHRNPEPNYLDYLLLREYHECCDDQVGIIFNI